MIFENAFASLSYMTVANLLQLSPVKKAIILKYFDRDSMTHFQEFLGLSNLFIYPELTGVVK